MLKAVRQASPRLPRYPSQFSFKRKELRHVWPPHLLQHGPICGAEDPGQGPPGAGRGQAGAVGGQGERRDARLVRGDELCLVGVKMLHSHLQSLQRGVATMFTLATHRAECLAPKTGCIHQTLQPVGPPRLDTVGPHRAEQRTVLDQCHPQLNARGTDLTAASASMTYKDEQSRKSTKKTRDRGNVHTLMECLGGSNNQHTHSLCEGLAICDHCQDVPAPSEGQGKPGQNCGAPVRQRAAPLHRGTCANRGCSQASCPGAPAAVGLRGCTRTPSAPAAPPHGPCAAARPSLRSGTPARPRIGSCRHPK